MADRPSPPPLSFALDVEQPGAVSALLYRESWQDPVSVRAIVRVTAEANAGARPRAGSDHAVLLAFDLDVRGAGSGRAAALAKAAGAVVEALPDGAAFAVLGGRARGEAWQTIDPQVRERICAGREPGPAAGVPTLRRDGLATWLAAARELFASRPAAVHHLVLVTDGGTTEATPGRHVLGPELSPYADEFGCDVVGVGQGLPLEALADAADRLHGTLALVRGTAQLRRELGARVRALLDVRVPAVPLRIRARRGVEVAGVEEVAPVRRPLGVRALGPPDGSGRRLHAVTTRLWDAGRRDYRLRLRARPHGEPLDEPVELASLTLEGPGGRGGPPPSPVVVRWTLEGETIRRGGQAPTEFFYERHEALQETAARGARAAAVGDLARVFADAAGAYRMAWRQKDTNLLRRLSSVLDVTDEAAGQVRLRPDATLFDLVAALLHARRVQPSDGVPQVPAGRTDCPRCRASVGSDWRYCARCGAPLQEGGEA